MPMTDQFAAVRDQLRAARDEALAATCDGCTQRHKCALNGCAKTELVERDMRYEDPVSSALTIRVPVELLGGATLGVWVPIGHGLEAMARAVDPAGSFHLRAFGTSADVWVGGDHLGQEVPIPGTALSAYAQADWDFGRLELRPQGG